MAQNLDSRTRTTFCNPQKAEFRLGCKCKVAHKGNGGSAGRRLQYPTTADFAGADSTLVAGKSLAAGTDLAAGTVRAGSSLSMGVDFFLEQKPA